MRPVRLVAGGRVAGGKGKAIDADIDFHGAERAAIDGNVGGCVDHGLRGWGGETKAKAGEQARGGSHARHVWWTFLIKE